MQDQAEVMRALLDECKDVIRQGHQFLKDARQTRKELEELIAKTQIEANLQFANIVAAETVKLGESLKKVTDLATKKVFARYDQIVAILMGETPKDGGETLEQIAKRVRATMEAHGTASVRSKIPKLSEEEL